MQIDFPACLTIYFSFSASCNSDALLQARACREVPLAQSGRVYSAVHEVPVAEYHDMVVWVVYSVVDRPLSVIAS
jgi:hypothetical protein